MRSRPGAGSSPASSERVAVATWDGRRVLVVSHSANRWALDYLLHGRPLEELVDAPFTWQEGWECTVPAERAADA